MMRRAFSLVELILAIFILGIGMISVAALFPAGIIQQQFAEDDVYGPIVANHALSVSAPGSRRRTSAPSRSSPPSGHRRSRAIRCR